MTRPDQGENGPGFPVSIVRVLSAVLQKKDWQRCRALIEVFKVWDSVVGPDVAMHAQPYQAKGATLWVKVSDPVWMQQLHLQKILLLEKINSQLKEEKFTDLRLQLDASLGDQPPGKPVPNKPVPPPDLNQLREIENLLAPLQDNEARTALKRLWLKLHSRQSPPQKS